MLEACPEDTIWYGYWFYIIVFCEWKWTFLAAQRDLSLTVVVSGFLVNTRPANFLTHC